MKNRKKRAQREEVRKVLHSMRLELAAQRVAYEHGQKPQPLMGLHEIITRARSVSSYENK